ncbi:hypothetical protein M899_2324 [Bacteriovorax sp. BSW11_IV]|uniref:hypothetical protein n=1 Tax=Bacteriovorax sp. BSW11_IV TaxID=1353529 RepID=UPI000389DC91|nr:hypothetical protein [Bacteriovorax sp. BSW11_IV]EQC44471.1 hypothetical protein M899_2324 [Bacteriovorax sp. BSW11_IV]
MNNQRLLLLLILNLILPFPIMAKSLRPFSEKEVSNFSGAKRIAIYNTYIKFQILDERNTPIPRVSSYSFGTKDKIETFTSLFFPENAYANGASKCFYGTYPSQVVNQSCEHPAKIANSGYKSSCGQNEFQCNPLLFKQGSCVENAGPYQNLTDACIKKGKLSPSEIADLVASPKFRKYQNNVLEYCNQAKQSGDCMDLEKKLDEIVRADDSIKAGPIVRDVEEIIQNVNKPTLNRDCFATQEINRCPQVIADSLDNVYSNGVVGALNYVFSDGKFKDPRSICQSSLPKDLDIVKLKSELKERFPNDDQLSQFAEKCDSIALSKVEDGRKESDSNVAPAYMMVDYNMKSEKIQKSINDLMESKANLDATLGENSFNCSEFRGSYSNANHCLDLKACELGKANELFEQKLDSTTSAVEAARKIQDELYKINKKISSLGYGSYMNAGEAAQLIERQKELKAQQNVILDSNPILRGKHFKKIMAKARASTNAYSYNKPAPEPTKDEISKALRQQMKDSSKEIDGLVNDYQRALQCLKGQRTSCSDFDKILKRANYNTENRMYLKSPNLNKLNNFYTCVEGSKQNRDEADEVLIDVGVSIALSFTPLFAVNVLKVAVTASKVIKATSTINKGALAADTVFAGNQAMKVYDACKEAEVTFLQTPKSEVRSCGDRMKESLAATNMDRCRTQAAFSAALAAPVVLSSFKLAKVPKTTPPTPPKATAQTPTKTPPVNRLATLKEAEQRIAAQNAVPNVGSIAGKESTAVATKQSTAVAKKQDVVPKVESPISEFIGKSTDIVVSPPRVALENAPIQGFATRILDPEKLPSLKALTGPKPTTPNLPIPYKAQLPATTPKVVEGEFLGKANEVVLRPNYKLLENAPIDVTPTRAALGPTKAQLPAKTGTGVATTGRQVSAEGSGEYIGKATDVIVRPPMKAIEADALPGTFSRVVDEPAKIAPVNRLATLKEAEQRIAAQNAVRTPPVNRLATLKEAEQRIAAGKPQPTTQGSALRIVNERSPQRVLASQAASIAYTASRDNETNQNQVPPTTSAENESGPEVQGLPGGEIPPEEPTEPSAESLFDFVINISTTETHELLTPEVISSMPDGARVSFTYSCNTEIAPCNDKIENDGVKIARKDKENLVTVIGLLIGADGSELARVEQTHMVSPLDSAPSRDSDDANPGISIKLVEVKKEEKSYKLKVVKNGNFTKDHIWFCSKVRIKKDESPKAACSESSGGIERTYARKSYSYYVKVKQQKNDSNEFVNANFLVRKCDTDACLNPTSDRAPAMALPPSGTNTPPNNLNFNIPRKKVIITPGFL